MMEKRPKAPERLNGIVAVVCNYSAVRVRVCVSASARKRVIMKSHSEESGAGGRVLISLGAHRNFSLARCVCVYTQKVFVRPLCVLYQLLCVYAVYGHIWSTFLFHQQTERLLCFSSFHGELTAFRCPCARRPGAPPPPN